MSLSAGGGDDAGVDSLAREGLVAIEDVMTVEAIDGMWCSNTSKNRGVQEGWE
jgi:hypothetical protein